MGHQTHNLIFIPTARHVDHEMQVEVGKIPPVLIPINGKPILDLLIKKYSELPGITHFVLAVNEGKKEIYQQLSKMNDPDSVQVVEVGDTDDLADTIQRGLEQIDLKSFDNLYINFGDTLVEAPLDVTQDTIFYDVLPESYRWTTFQENKDLIEIADKYCSDRTNENSVMAGVFLFKAPEAFQSSLTSCTEPSSIGRFYAAMLKYLKNRTFDLSKVTEWIDFGHVDNYYSAKRKYLNKRFFNQIKIDEHRAVLEKRSNHIEKFYGEIKWYLELPRTLKCYTPQVFDYSYDDEKSFIHLEYYGYPPLSDLYLLSGHSLAIWNHVLDSIYRVAGEMRSHTLDVDPHEIQRSFNEMYVTKTIERVMSIANHPVLGSLIFNPLEINGKEYRPLLEMLQTLSKVVNDKLISTHSGLSVIHGDLCLSNLLFDPKNRIIKLIDPRGNFGGHTIYGDFRYDLAKLSHSFSGHYELMIADSFFTVCEGNSIQYSLIVSDRQNELRSMFEARLGKEYGPHLEAIRFIQSLLFLSMVPLHEDHLNRQIIMLANGIEQLHSCLSC